MANSLMSFPDEVLLFIFQYCDTQSLGRLAGTCKRFKCLIDIEDCWYEKSRSVLGSNMISTNMQKKSVPTLTSKKKCEVSTKWVRGFPSRRTVVRYDRCMPWILLEKRFLFASVGRQLIQLSRNADGNVQGYRRISVPPQTDDISKFAINGDEVVTASRDGNLNRWSTTTLHLIHSDKAHTCDIHCVDAKGNIMVTGSRDQTVKIWMKIDKETVNRTFIDLNVRVLSIALMPSIKNFIVGLPGTNNIHPLQFFDLQRAHRVMNFGRTFRVGAGILDIHPECENTFLSCGYDTTVKLWDVRTPNNFVSSWMDPYDNGIYCVKSDQAFTIVSGASRNSVVHVWDKRCTQARKIYHVAGPESPTYSIEFDASHLYAAFARAIIQFSYL